MEEPRVAGPPTASESLLAANAVREGAHDRFTREIIPALCRAAKVYGLDPAVAVAQAAHETGWGRYGGTVPPEWLNTCGLKVREGGGDRDRHAHMRFASWDAGAHAHCQHLAAYAGVPLPAGTVLLDPRYGWVGPGTRHYGSARLVRDLDAWSGRDGYGESVRDVYRRLVRPKHDPVG